MRASKGWLVASAALAVPALVLLGYASWTMETAQARHAACMQAHPGPYGGLSCMDFSGMEAAFAAVPGLALLGLALVALAAAFVAPALSRTGS